MNERKKRKDRKERNHDGLPRNGFRIIIGRRNHHPSASVLCSLPSATSSKPPSHPKTKKRTWMLLRSSVAVRRVSGFTLILLNTCTCLRSPCEPPVLQPSLSPSPLLWRSTHHAGAYTRAWLIACGMMRVSIPTANALTSSSYFTLCTRRGDLNPTGGGGITSFSGRMPCDFCFL